MRVLKPIFITFIFATIAFVIHKLGFLLFAPKELEKTFVYTLPLLYSFFFFFTATILFVLIKINQKNKNNVGFAFMLLTSIKIAAAYFFMQPILHSTNKFIHYEKFNFFAIFILFLIIETIITIKIVNNE